MKANKLLVLALTAVAAAGLSACGNTTTDKVYSDVNTKINIWATAKEEAVIKNIVDAYNAKQKDETKKFNYEFTAVAESDAGTTLQKDPNVKNAPALLLCADDHISGLANKGIILELKGEFKKTVVDNNTPVSVLGATYNNGIYGYPVTSDNGYFLWYNASALQANDVTTLEGLLAKAKSSGKKVLMDIPNGWYVNSFFTSPDLCGTDSLRFATEKDPADGVVKTSYTCNWDNANAVAAVEYLSGLLKPYYADGTLITGSNENIVAGFQDKSLIAAVSGTWMEGDLEKAMDGDTLAATKLPTYTVNNKTIQMSSFTGSKIYTINKTRPVAEQKAAAALADLLTTKESQLKRFETRQSIPCNKEAVNDERYTKNVSKGAKALEQQNAFAAVQAQSAEGRYWDIGKAIGQAIIDGELGTYTTWKDFMEYQVGLLKQKQ